MRRITAKPASCTRIRSKHSDRPSISEGGRFSVFQIHFEPFARDGRFNEMTRRTPNVITDSVEPEERLHLLNRLVHLELIGRRLLEQFGPVRFSILGELLRGRFPLSRLFRGRMMSERLDHVELMQDELTRDQEVRIAECVDRVDFPHDEQPPLQVVDRMEQRQMLTIVVAPSPFFQLNGAQKHTDVAERFLDELELVVAFARLGQ